MSVSPRQNFLKPPPVPEMPTVTLTAPFFAFWNSSATASVTGKTVLEPSTFTTCAGRHRSAAPTPPSSAATAASNPELFHAGLSSWKARAGVIRRVYWPCVTAP